MSKHSLAAIVALAKRYDRPAVLATVVDTAGSTYRKPGARMLIGGEGVLAGVVGGGCFDSDLVERAAICLSSGNAHTTTYDMRSPDEAIWGLGLGCEGAATVLFQPLARPHSCPLLSLLDHAIEQGGWIATDIDMDGTNQAGVSRQIARHANSPGVRVIDGRKTFVERISPPPHLVICGAGVDAVPVATLAADLAWRVSVVDHRPGYLERNRFPDSVTLMSSEAWVAADCDAAVIMSHHLPSDIAYLRRIIATNTPYIGLLGPSARRERLIEECSIGVRDQDRVRGPAGLDLGGELPEEVALSIVAEVNASRYGANSQPWTGQARK